MLYAKKAHPFERVLHHILRAVLIASALLIFLLAFSGAFSGLSALALFATGIIVAATGFFGWCPACSLFGRISQGAQ